MTNVTNLAGLATGISTQSKAIRKYAIAQAAATKSQEAQLVKDATRIANLELSVADAWKEIEVLKLKGSGVTDSPPYTPPPTGPPFGANLPARIPVSSGSVISVTNDAQLRSALSSCAFGSIIDGGGNTFSPGASLYYEWTRDGGGVVTTLRNCIFNSGYMQIKKGKWFRLQDCVSNTSQYFGFKSEGGQKFEVLRCQANNANYTGYMVTVAADNTPSIDWQIWDSGDYHCGYGSGSVQSHSIYAETHNANCVIANHIGNSPNYFGAHVSTDRTLAENPYTDGLWVVCSVFANNAHNASAVLYSNQSGVDQKNVKFIGVISKSAPGGILWSYDGSGLGNGVYGCVKYLAGGVSEDYQIGNVTVDTLVTGNPQLDANFRPGAGSSAKDIIPAAMAGYIPQYDRDGLQRLTKDAGAFRCP